MKRQLLQGIILISALMLYGQSLSAKSKPRFSHKGIKAALGFGNVDMPSSTTSGDGGAGMLSLGYGFSERSTLWLSLIGTDTDSRSATRIVTEFGGIELAYQYKFRPESSFQPYGKVGVGAYALQENGTDPTLIGGGFNFAFGADYFFSRHFGIGAEFNFKDIEYSIESRTVNGEEIVSDLRPHLNRDSRAFLITLTIQ
ncbi:porin family protein [candidate division KSB1 bacterium]|nr:porin family protein [candidate division KSB1 bacterium]